MPDKIKCCGNLKKSIKSIRLNSFTKFADEGSFLPISNFSFNYIYKIYNKTKPIPIDKNLEPNQMPGGITIK